MNQRATDIVDDEWPRKYVQQGQVNHENAGSNEYDDCLITLFSWFEFRYVAIAKQLEYKKLIFRIPYGINV